MVDVVGPGQSVIYNYTEKLETGHPLNFRASEVDQLGLLGTEKLETGHPLNFRASEVDQLWLLGSERAYTWSYQL